MRGRETMAVEVEVSGAELERARWPRIAAPPRPELRSVLPRGYAGITRATAPRHLVLPATTLVPLVVKLVDSARRPPQFVMGAHGSFTVPEGECAPSYLEVWLAPLAAYRLLGVPMGALSGLTVDLGELLDGDGRRLAESVREAPTWRRRFALVERFLLRRIEAGPEPSSEVAWAWRCLAASGGALPIHRLAGEVGWSHIRDFREFTGTTPTTFLARTAAGRQVNSVQDAPATRP